jgi:hypothetical protein
MEQGAPERLGRDDKDTTTNFGDGNLSGPFKTADVAFALTGIHGKKREPSEQGERATSERAGPALPM